MSEETKNPLIESFLKLHEAQTVYAGPAGGSGRVQSNLPTQSLRPAYTRPADAPVTTNPTAGSQGMTFGGGGPTGIRPSIPSMSGGSVNRPTVRPAIDTAPTIDNSASMQRAKTDYQTRVAGVERQNPISAPGKLEGGNLQMGSRGDSVKELQRKLGIKDDGIFGKNTAAALKSFQQKNNLKVDAIYGKQSASAMNRQSSMNALKKENPVGAALTTPIASASRERANFGGSPSGVKPLSLRPTTVNAGAQNASDILRNKLRPSSTQDSRLLKPSSTLMAHYEPGEDMSNKLIEAFLKLHSTNSPDLFAEAKKAKKLDPVGKEDEDIDNDGDSDKSDKYLHNRRKAIARAMKEGKDPYAEKDAGSDNEEVEQIDELTGYRKKKLFGKDQLAAVANRAINRMKLPPNDGGKLSPEEIKSNRKNSKVSRMAIDRMDEEVEQIDELKKSALEKVRNRAAGRMMDDPRDEKAHKVEKQASKRLKKITDAEKEESSKRAYKAYKEEFEEDVEFSEAEIEHITSILEAMPVAPTSDVNKAFGKSASISGTLTDEVLAKKKLKEEAEDLDEEEKKAYTGKKRGRKPGVKVGAYGPRGGGASSGESSGNVSVPHVAHQIRHGKPDSQGNYTLQHHVGNDKKGNPIIHTVKVAAQHAVRFYGDYHGTEKPRDKEAKTDAFISKHFNISKPKATGISLPKMPAPKS